MFNVPFYGITHAEAERSFRTAVNDPQTSLNKFPEDFDLWYLGTYCTNTGRIDALETPVHMIKAIHCIKKDQSFNSSPELRPLSQ